MHQVRNRGPTNNGETRSRCLQYLGRRVSTGHSHLGKRQIDERREYVGTRESSPTSTSTSTSTSVTTATVHASPSSSRPPSYSSAYTSLPLVNGRLQLVYLIAGIFLFGVVNTSQILNYILSSMICAFSGIRLGPAYDTELGFSTCTLRLCPIPIWT